MRRFVFLAVATVAAVASAQSINQQGNYDVEWDQFRAPFDATSPSARWFYFGAGPFVGNDGIETVGHGRLRVRAKGTNPTTGAPAFTKTVAPESQSGLPGGVDHVKWLVYMNNLSTRGYPGFDAVSGKELSCEARIGGRTFGTENHPFGTIVDNPNSDLRLASFALNTIDFETFMVFDFFITNEVIYAFYERLPFGRGPALGNYASFSHMIPVRQRNNLNETYKLRIGYDRATNTVRWYINEQQVFQVSRLGYRLDRDLITLDHGGTETEVFLNQMDCGMGLFTLLDAWKPSEIGLVRLSETPGFYFDPLVGEPAPSAFFDDYSNVNSRLFGQGAQIEARDYRVSSKPIRRGHCD